MRKTVVVALVLIVMALSPVDAQSQSTRRTNIRAGDVWTLETAGFGGFVEWMISWTKKADFDLLVEASADDGETFFAVCRGQSTQDGFERCHHGQGQTIFATTIIGFSGAKKAKGALWVSVTDERIGSARSAGGAEPKYRGNIYDETDDPLLLRIRAELASRPATKKPMQR